MESRCRLVGIIAVSMCVAVARAPGQTPPVQTLVATDVPEPFGIGFGGAVAISGDFLAVTAPSDPWYNGDENGALYVFRREGTRWVQHVKLHAPNPAFHDYFGYTVAMDDDWLIAASLTGVVVLRRNFRATPTDLTDDTWDYQTTLVPYSLPYANVSLAIDHDRLVVGNLRGSLLSGQAFIYDWNGGDWGQPVIITPSDPESEDWFGYQVAVSGDIVGVAAYRDTYECPEGGQCRGSSYIFRRVSGAWTQETKVIAFAPTETAGRSIGVSGDRVAVGGARVANLYQLAADQWIHETTLVPDDLYFGSDFATSIAVDENVLLVGAPGALSPAFSGAVYVYRLGSAWLSDRTLADPQGDRRVGHSVALAGDWAVSGGDGAFLFRICAGCGSLREYAAFQNCFHSDIGAPGSDCCRMDFFENTQVDLQDLEALVNAMTGP